MAGLGGGDLVARGLQRRVAVLGEDARVARAGNEGAENLQSREADELRSAKQTFLRIQIVQKLAAAAAGVTGPAGGTRHCQGEVQGIRVTG